MLNVFQFAVITDDGIIHSRPFRMLYAPDGRRINDLWREAKGFKSAADMDTSVDYFTNFLKNAEVIDDSDGNNMNPLFLDSSGKNRIMFNDHYLADAVILKNLSDTDFNVSPAPVDEQDVGLYENDALILADGSFYAGTDKDIAKCSALNALYRYEKKVSENDLQYNYEELTAICESYEKKYGTDLYLQKLVDDVFTDTAGLKANISGYYGQKGFLTWLRGFIGDTADAEFYSMLDGKLKAADAGDFREVADILCNKLAESIKPEPPCETVRLSRQAEDCM